MRFSRFLAAASTLTVIAPAAHAQAEFRPPAVPLVASDPYLSIWSMADRLTDKATQHWTQREHPLVSLIRIDGKSYRLMGNAPQQLPAFPQTHVQVLPTRSIYEFEDTGVHVTLTFMTPSLPHDLDVLTRPVTYLTWDVRSVDGVAHSVSLYDSASALLTVNTPQTPVSWQRGTMGSLIGLQAGASKQTLLSPPGDDTRINWGYAYLAAPAKDARATVGAEDALQSEFVKNGSLPSAVDAQMPRPADERQPVMALAFDLGKVGKTAVSRHALIGYDELYSVKFFGENLRPYWRRNGMTPTQLFETAEHDYSSLQKRCADFDKSVMADAASVGGPEYAQMCALAYRQSLAATGIAADANKQPLMFTKENSSNGDIATVDIIFPQDPMLILFSPTLAKASVVPILLYSASPRWKFPNAPHDLGTYPVARGTDDGGEQMPVEESGNILIICDAIAKEEGNTDFVSPWWPQLTQWAQYLEQFGKDPENQLSTDDFMGHLAHNSNLSVKAILALAAYGDLCRRRGETANADRYQALAKEFAAHWMEAANDGDHYNLAFDKPGTWSQKYNLVWDKILDLNVFPPSVAQKEIAQYKSVMQPYGVPLDSRTKLTKVDWSIWSATLADNRQDFETLTQPIYAYLNKTTSRLPFVDSYVTDNIHSDGMRARPVIGGVFIKMLADTALWKKWSSGDKQTVGNWAPLPLPPTLTDVVPTSKVTPATWRYTTDTPPADWFKTDFSDAGWKEGKAPIGNIPGSNTPWNQTPGDLWMRRTITLPNQAYPNLQFSVFHDEDTEIYVNGVLAASEAGFNTGYEPVAIAPEALALMKPGATITIAAHVHQTGGGQGLDIGLVNVTPAK